VGPLVVPGHYKLRLTVDGKVLPMGGVEVLPDPRVKRSPQDYAEQYQTQLSVLADINKITAAVDRLRSLKKQVATRNELLKDVAKART